jgi:hypothetical protein
LQTSNLILDFEFDQHLESHKHVINIIMGFRDMRCYNRPPPRLLLASLAVHQYDDTTRLEHGDRSDLEPDVLAMTLSKLSMDPYSYDFVMPLELCTPICLNQVTWSLMLSEMPSLDNSTSQPDRWGTRPVACVSSGRVILAPGGALTVAQTLARVRERRL